VVFLAAHIYHCSESRRATNRANEGPDMAVNSRRLRSPHDAPATREPVGIAPPAVHPPTRRQLLASANRAVPFAATLALVLLTLAVGIVPLLGQAPQAPGEPHRTPALVRAMQTAPGRVDDVVLAEAVFRFDQLPPGAKEVVFFQLTIPPDVTLTALSGPSCGCPGRPVNGGVGAEVVQAGHYSIRLSTPIEVQRRSGAPDEAIAAHTEVTLGPGDAAIYPDYTATAEIRVAGDAPVELIGVAIVGSDGSVVPAPMLPDGVRSEELGRSLAREWEKLAGGPVSVSMHRMTLPAALYVGPYEPIGPEAMRVERGEVSRIHYQPGAVDPVYPLEIWREGQTSPLLGNTPGMRHALITFTEEPSELLVLLVEPAGMSAQSLAP
jgi:hypothetical protein